MSTPHIIAKPSGFIGRPIAGEAAKTTGFASPAADYLDRSLDLHQLLVPHPAGTFFVRVSYRPRGSKDVGKDGGGAILVVDRTLTPHHGQLVIAALQGRLSLRRLLRYGRQIRLTRDHQFADNAYGGVCDSGDDGSDDGGGGSDLGHGNRATLFDLDELTPDPAQEGQLVIWGVVTAIIQRLGFDHVRLG